MTGKRNSSFLVHAFPRASLDPDQEIAAGIQTLVSILDVGLLLVPELISFPMVGGNDPDDTGTDLLQIRSCFTFLRWSRRDICEHAVRFGSFSVVFDPEKLRRVGAVPVIYVPRPSHPSLDDDYSLLASAFVHQLRDLDVLLEEIIMVQDAFSGFDDHDEDFSVAACLGKRQSQLHIGTVKQLLAFLKGKKGSFEDLRGMVQGMSTLFYHVDSARREKIFMDADLRYYLQSEWRIVSGVHLEGDFLDEPLTTPEATRIKGFDALFSKMIGLPNGESIPAIELVRVIRSFKGKPFHDLIERIVVPGQCVSKVEHEVKERGLSIPVDTISLERIHKIRNQDQA